jgi:hypothetical protein
MQGPRALTGRETPDATPRALGQETERVAVAATRPGMPPSRHADRVLPIHDVKQLTARRGIVSGSLRRTATSICITDAI